jgi:tRNA(Arg) A34 adenosine deaminase TadA
MKSRVVIVAFCYDAKGILLGTASNSYTKTHPIQAYFAEKVGHPHKIYLHAEIAAILRCKDKQIYTIKIYRYGQDGQLALANPCPICREGIKAYKIPHLFYSTPKGMIYECQKG